MMIFGVILEMPCQRIDPFRQDGDLNFRRASIALVGSKRADNFGLAFFRQHDLVFSLSFFGNVIIQKHGIFGKSMRSILVKLPNWMGDILFSLDLLYTLATHFDRIGLLTAQHHADLFSIFPLSGAEIIPYLPETWPNLDRETILRVEAFQADCGLLLTNSIGSAMVLRWAGVSDLYGYDTEHRAFLLKHSLPAPEYQLHQAKYYLELLKLFDLDPISYPAPVETNRERLILIHAGASKPPRGWHVERFCKVAEQLQQKGLNVLFVSQHEMRDIPFPVMRNPPLEELAAQMKRCALFVGNDSGPLHLAQQCGAPVVGIYGPGTPMTTGPRAISPHKIVYHAFPCSPCRQKFFKECNPAPSQKPYCIETISVDEVLQACLGLIG